MRTVDVLADRWVPKGYSIPHLFRDMRLCVTCVMSTLDPNEVSAERSASDWTLHTSEYDYLSSMHYDRLQYLVMILLLNYRV